MLEHPSFEWDEEKDLANQEKHGVSFKESSQAFFDPLGLIIPDPDHSEDEDRFILLAFGAGKLLVTVFTERGDAIRIISSRKANARERKAYEQSDQ